MFTCSRVFAVYRVVYAEYARVNGLDISPSTRYNVEQL